MPESDQERVFSPPLKITLVAPNPDQDIFNADAETIAQLNSQGEPDSGLALPSQAQLFEQSQPQETQPFSVDGTQSSASSAQDKKNRQETRDLLTSGINLAYLNSQAKPREKFVSADTKQSLYAAYIEKWRLAVEKVGNLNYPDAAKQQNLEGSLVLDVTLLSNGEIDSVKLLRSSGHKILDDGAERIVFLSAPFEPFSKGMSAEIDKLHIIRTWKFGRNRFIQ